MLVKPLKKVPWKRMGWSKNSLIDLNKKSDNLVWLLPLDYRSFILDVLRN